MSSSTLYHDLMALIREVGNIIRTAHDVDTDENVAEKSGTANFVTVFDVRVQDFLIRGIQDLLPDAVFIAEEKENDNEVLAAEHCFIIDPIDGTANFICDFHHSAISVALLCRGVTVFGAVYDPFLDEMFYAERGKGAFCNGKPMHVSSRPIERAMVTFGTSPYYKDTLADPTFALCKRMLMACSDLRRSGSAALDLAYLAAGRTDIFFECRLSPWDIAAGSLLIVEAGGVMTDFGGAPISLDAPSSVLATNSLVYDSALQMVKSVNG